MPAAVSIMVRGWHRCLGMRPPVRPDPLDSVRNHGRDEAGDGRPEAPVDLFDLTGKVAVVTGGTRGIGLMMVRGLLQAGASVYVSSRKPEAGEHAVAVLSQFGEVRSIPANVSTEAECLRLAEEVGRREERLHVLVNNAGATGGEPLATFPPRPGTRCST